MYRAGPVPSGTGRTGPVPTGSVNPGHGPYVHSGGGTGLGPLVAPVPRRACAARVRRADVAGAWRRRARERRAA
jgi:hypothetical protein